MLKYVAKVKELATTLDKFEISHIPRSKNKRDDELNKLAYSAFSRLSKKVLVEVLHNRSIEEETVVTITTSRNN